MKLSSSKLAALLLTSVASLAPIHAQSNENAPLFDATVLAHTCLNCHGGNGNAAQGERLAIPNIFDRPAETTYQQLVAFQQETLPPNTTIMNRLMAAFNDDELKAIADAVAKIKVEE